MAGIDAHQHFWSPSRGDHGWMVGRRFDAIRRDLLPDTLKPYLEQLGIAQTVLVQAAPTIAETEFLLGLAERHDWIAAVVGWVDFDDRSHLRHLERLARHPKFVGMRPMIQDIADPDWMLSRSVQWGFETVAALDLAFDALGFPRHMDNFRRLFDMHPTMRVVLDHALKPSFRMPEDEAWFRGLEQLARETAAFCKLSGLVTEAGPQWSTVQLAPYVDHIVNCFGADRVMWGSDWPVCELAATYQSWHDAARSLTHKFNASAAIFGETARHFYLRRRSLP